jgi:DnaJ like chaperone protein
MKWGKWIGGGLGWALFGPIGGLLGFAVGSIIDADENVSVKTTQGDFIASLLVLIAAVMKADGTVKRSELEYVKTFLRSVLSEKETLDALLQLREIIKKDIDLDPVCIQINRYLDYSSKMQLAYLLIELAQSDNEFSQAEKNVLILIFKKLELPLSTFQFLVKKDITLEEAYNILGVSEKATDEEIKKAYRKLAMEHHPDRVAYLGEEIQKKAQEKFKKISEAYELIKNQRNIK